MEAAATGSYCHLTPSTALQSVEVTLPALLPLHGCIMGWDTTTEPLSLGSALLNPEGECKAGSASGFRFSPASATPEVDLTMQEP